MKTFCSYYNLGTCSSCTRIEEEYLTQVRSKSEHLKTLLKNFLPFELLGPVASSPTRFRNKAKLSITGSVDHPVIGLTGESELDLGREILECPLHHEEINHLLRALPAFIKLANLSPYQIKLRSGELKGAIVFYSTGSKEMYLRLILRSKESLDRIRKHAPALLNQFPQLKSLSANIQPVPHAVLEGEEEIFFTDSQHVQHRIGDVTMALHPLGFVQTNQMVAEQLYTTAADWVRELGPSTFLELFSGQGAFSFFIQKHVTKALGVEINPEAVERANRTAAQMGWDHLRFIAQDAAQVEGVLTEFDPDVVLVNPPRRGLGGARDLILRSTAKYFIYSSCNASSLAQDLEFLSKKFTVVRAQVFDMFPNTDHYETLVLLRATGADGTA